MHLPGRKFGKAKTPKVLKLLDFSKIRQFL